MVNLPKCPEEKIKTLLGIQTTDKSDNPGAVRNLQGIPNSGAILSPVCNRAEIYSVIEYVYLGRTNIVFIRQQRSGSIRIGDEKLTDPVVQSLKHLTHPTLDPD